MHSTQYYSNYQFDRAVHLRNSTVKSPKDQSAKVIPVWRDQFFFTEKKGGLVPVTSVPDELLNQSIDILLLGIENNEEIACIDLSSFELSFIKTRLDYTSLSDLRNTVHQIENRYAALLAYSKGIIRWNNSHIYCGSCGSKTAMTQRGHCRTCINPSCGSVIFPRIDPAIIVLIEYKPENGPAECLLNRRATDFGHICSTFAGFVEIGESLEDAVRREMKEEVNVDVKNLTYMASQPWPFPSSIMIGFKAEVHSKQFEVDHVEIKDAKWYTAQEIKELVQHQKLQLSKSDSIARFLIETWVENNS